MSGMFSCAMLLFGSEKYSRAVTTESSGSPGLKSTRTMPPRVWGASLCPWTFATACAPRGHAAVGVQRMGIIPVPTPADAAKCVFSVWQCIPLRINTCIYTFIYIYIYVFLYVYIYMCKCKYLFIYSYFLLIYTYV